MRSNIKYEFRYVPGEIERTRALWNEFQQGATERSWDPDSVHFIPALGGCFLVIDEQTRAGWVQSMTMPKLKNPKALLEDFWQWMQETRPILPQGLSVMVVDDDQSFLKLLRIVFESSGYEVRTFGDVPSALDALGGSTLPDVMVVDLRMPGMDGRDFVREVRRLDINSRIIIASGFEARGAQAELHADGAIQKPFLPDDLIALVRSLPPIERTNPVA